MPSGATSAKFDFNSDVSRASSSSGVKRTYSESTALPNLPGVTSGSGVKRACSGKYCALPNPPVVSSASGLKRAHEKDNRK